MPQLYQHLFLFSLHSIILFTLPFCTASTSLFCIFFSASPWTLTILPPLHLSAIIFITLFFSLLLSTVHGLSATPLQQQPHLSKREGVLTLPPHRPLERTRSEPPPYSHSPVKLHTSHHSHTQHHLQQQYHKSGLERFKLNAHLSKVRGGRHKQCISNTDSHRSLCVDYCVECYVLCMDIPY